MKFLVFLAFMALNWLFAFQKPLDSLVIGSSLQNNQSLTSVNPQSTQILSVISNVNQYTALSPDSQTLLLYEVGINGFLIYNVSDLQSPTLASSYYLITKLSVQYVGATFSLDSKTVFIIYCDMGSEYLEVVDLSNTTSPVKLASQTLFQSMGYMFSATQAIAISPDGQTIFVWMIEEESSTLGVIDVSNIKKPKEISNLTHAGDTNSYRLGVLSIVDNKLFFTDSATVVVVDISDLYTPTLIQSITGFNGSVTGMEVSSDGKTVYTVTRYYIDPNYNGRTLQIINMTDTSSQTNISIYLGTIKSTESDDEEPEAEGTGFMAVSPNNDYIFLAGFDSLMLINITDLQNLTYQAIQTIPNPTFVTLSADGRIAVVSDDFKVSIVELYLDVQMTKVFSLPTSANIQEILLESNYTFTPIETMSISADGNSVFMIDGSGHFAIFDISNLTSPNFQSAFNVPCNSISSFKISPDEKSAFVVCLDSVVVINISNVASPTHLATYYPEQQWSVSNFDVSPDGQTGFMTTIVGLNITNISNLASPTKLNTFGRPGSDFEAVSFGLSNDASLGFMLITYFDPGQYFSLQTINTSNVTSLVNISLLDIGYGTDDITNQQENIMDISILPNNEAVFITLNGPGLMIYDFSDPTEPVRIFWPDIIAQTSLPVLFSQDSSTAFIATSTDLLVVDISTLASPMILRAYPIPSNSISTALSQDEWTLYLGLDNGTLIVLSLEPEYVFDVLEREYQLGGVYSNSLVPLQLNAGNKFNPMNQSFSFIEISLYSVETLPGDTQATTTYPPLPNWMSFEQDQGILTVTPVSVARFGSYQIYGALSSMIPNDTFTQIPNISNQTASQDLFGTLISLGYLDTEGFLTSRFNPGTKLFLFSQYSDLESDIRGILSEYYIEIATSIFVTPSLSLSFSTSISISTKSQNALSVIIQVSSSKAQFVSNNYATVAMISSNSSTITLEGSLASINTALTQIIINLNGTIGCDGSVAIYDGLNPAVNQSITDICQYFVKNQAPALNSHFSIQVEIDRTSVLTGEEFMIDLTSTFIDFNGLDLVYSISMQDQTEQVPEWLMLRGQTLVGTPPQQLSHSDISLLITAQNQFQSSRVAATIHIKISLSYALELIGTYGGALVTAIGLYIYINTIYNILCKKRYRYPKDFIIKVGDEASVHSICPVGFIGREIRASKAILKEIRHTVARELSVKSVSEKNLLDYFVDPETKQLSEDKLSEMIKNEMLNLEEKDKFKQEKDSVVKGHLRKQVIIQLVINGFLFMQLNLQEKVTKRVFNAVKRDWIHFVEVGSDPLQYKVNKKELEKKFIAIGVFNSKSNSVKVRDINSPENLELDLQLNGSGDNLAIENNTSNEVSPATPLVANSKKKSKKKAKGYDDVNFELLEKLIIAMAFKYHNLDVDAVNTKVTINQKPWGSSLWMKSKEFLKRDLLQIEFVGVGDTGFGIKYEIRKGVLRFYGAAEDELKSTTLVVHILNKKGRILRELWLSCISDEDREE